MKILLPVLLLLAAPLAVVAQTSYFGNPPDGSSFPLSRNADVGIQPDPLNSSLSDPYGALMAFTPLQTFTLTNVSLWLSGYTGANGMSIQLDIIADENDGPYYPTGAGATSPVTPNVPLYVQAPFTSPAPNSGGLAEFTFTGDTTLAANLVYYIYLIGNDAGGATFNVNLAASPVPSSSEVLYDGTENYGYFNGNLSYQGLDTSYSAAFELNAVPEPGTTALMLLGGAAAVLVRGRRRKCQF